MRIPFAPMLLSIGLGVLASAQGPGGTADREPVQDRSKQLLAVLDKKVALSERWVELAEHGKARLELMQRSGLGASAQDVIDFAGKVYEARIALATARQQLYAARGKYQGDKGAEAKVVEEIGQKIAAGRERVAELKQRLKSTELLVDAGRAGKDELERRRMRLLRVELDVLEFSRELAELHLTSGK